MSMIRWGELPLLVLIFLLGLMTPILLQGAGTGSSSSSDESGSAYERGLDWVKEENYTEAERLFSQSIEENQRVAQSYNMLGFSLRKQGKRLEAIQSYYKALDRKPDFPEAREYLGEAYLQGAEKQLDILKETHGKDNQQYEELRISLNNLAESHLR
mgnify:CR=1 FL=1